MTRNKAVEIEARRAEEPHTFPIRTGCCLIPGGGALLGLMLGGAYGIHDFNAAVDKAVREHGFADYLPVGVPIWAILGALIGALFGTSLVVLWLLVVGPQGSDDCGGCTGGGAAKAQ